MLRRNLTSIVMFGVFAVATAQVCFFNAVRYLPIGVALLLEYLGIIVVVAWMWAVHGQRPRRLTVAGSVVAVAGLALVLDLTGGGRLEPMGVLWGLGAGIGLASYFVLSARIDAALPSVALASGAILPPRLAIPAAIVILISSALYFADTHMKTADGYFRGFPALWNLVEFYLFLLHPDPSVSLAVVSIFVVMTFVPIYFAHPLRVKRWPGLNLIAFAAGVILGIAALFFHLNPPQPVVIGLLVVAAYFLVAGFVRPSKRST